MLIKCNVKQIIGCLICLLKYDWLLTPYLILIRKDQTAQVSSKKLTNPDPQDLHQALNKKGTPRINRVYSQIPPSYIHHLLTLALFLLLFIPEKAKPEIPLEAKTYGNAK